MSILGNMIYTNCQLCGCNKAELAYSYKCETGTALGGLEIRMVVCQECGFMYTNPRPSLQALKIYYSEALTASGSTYHDMTVNSRDYRLTIERRRFLMRCVKTSLGNRAILDIGCSVGDLLSSLDLPGWRLVGVEPSIHAAAIARERGLEVINEELHLANLPFEFFDVVCCINVLEHMYDIREALSIMASVTQPNGWLILEVPDSMNPVAQINEFFPFEHLSHFTHGTLVRLLTDFGFEVIDFDQNLSVPKIRVRARKNRKRITHALQQYGASNSDREKLLSVLSVYKRRKKELERQVTSQLNRLISKWREESARVAVYGAGQHTSFLLKLIDFSEFIIAVIDSDPKKEGTAFMGWTVYRPDSIEDLKLDAIVISSNHYQDEIYSSIIHHEGNGLEIVKCYP